MEIPRLEDYGVSPITGFLPENIPLQQLPEAYAEWENVVSDLPALIHTKQLRRMVDGMPVISTGKLRSVEEQRRAYSVLGFLAHAYVWSPPQVCDRLPRQIADPLVAVSESLGLPPVATFAGLCLWNFRTVVPCESGTQWSLENLASSVLYTGSYDEAWFYIISVALERQGGPCIANGLAALEAAHNGNSRELAERLDKLAADIDELTVILAKMPEFLDPHFFYHRLRPYLAGWKNMANEGLPDGVYYGDEVTARQYSGGSNGQSSLIQVLDILLNVEHHALGHRQPASALATSSSTTSSSEENGPKASKSSAFLIEMRNYMPREHRDFLQDLEQVAIIRDYVIHRKETRPNLVNSYDNALRALRDFRSKHIQVVMRYISMQARKNIAATAGTENSTTPNTTPNTASPNGMGLSKSNGSVGTGGTLLMPFLKQSRDEVSDAAAGNWGRSIITNVYSAPDTTHSVK